MSATTGTASTRKRLREDCHAVVSVSSPGCWNPPPLPTTTTDTIGQRLLHLLRALDKYDHHEHNDDDTKDKNDLSLSYLSTLSETLHLFQQLTDQVSRRGLLQGNNTLAERVLLLAASSSLDSGGMGGGGGGGRSSHKRKHKSGHNNHSASKSSNELTMMDHVPTVLDDLAIKGGGTNGTTTTLDVQLVLVAVSRVLEASSGSGSGAGTSGQSALSANHDKDPRWIVVAAAANLVTASSRVHTVPDWTSVRDGYVLFGGI
jgi:hypothetical protein